ncbi:MAG TPA: hypothetical protein VFU74_21845 [Actinocrinis sp.]|nr:hypothetical protein [Actinocrinis sp.]
MTDPSFRCGWRIQRHRDDSLPLYYYNEVTIRRGEWRMRMHAELFDHADDEAFNEIVTRAYREFAFEHLQADLDTLAKQLLGELKATGVIAAVDGVATSDVQAALYRWDRARRDMEGET